ncbi:hypothetical protein KC872_04535 [Candidatus Kaiserbacteria bacterium]|nr:hypothetical protein [Candidatus Kaiserbacteria bacterium]
MQAQIKYVIGFLVALLILVVGYVWADLSFGTVTYMSETILVSDMSTTTDSKEDTIPEVAKIIWPELLDTNDYDKRLLALVGYTPPVSEVVMSTSTTPSGAVITRASTTYATTSALRYSSSTNVTIDGEKWPPAAVYPNRGAVLPFQRILAYSGNFYSRQMGILGELEPEEMLAHLANTKAKWEKADPTTPVLPAIEYIAMVAQADAGVDGMYRAVMPDKEIEKAYALAKEIDGVMILDIQVGLSTVEVELPKFKKYLERPDVFFAIDPEFSMKYGNKPGTVIGTFDATDINYVIEYLSTIVREKHLPPKVLLVHRFTQDMVTHVSRIKPSPEVQVVMVMDGWGSKSLKYGTYSHVIEPEPVQFTGIKLFYKNDLKPPSSGLLSPAEVLDLQPSPIYIQYQ